MDKGIRWRQRFVNFEKSLKLLEQALAIKTPDIFQKAGTIQFFETTYDLAWKTLKDWLEDEGFAEIASPRAVIKKAFEVGVIKNGHTWMNLIGDRNITAHTYDEEKVSEVENAINERYYPLLKELYKSLLEKQ